MELGGKPTLPTLLVFCASDTSFFLDIEEEWGALSQLVFVVVWREALIH